MIVNVYLSAIQMISPLGANLLNYDRSNQTFLVWNYPLYIKFKNMRKRKVSYILFLLWTVFFLVIINL